MAKRNNETVDIRTLQKEINENYYKDSHWSSETSGCSLWEWERRKIESARSVLNNVEFESASEFLSFMYDGIDNYSFTAQTLFEVLLPHIEIPEGCTSYEPTIFGYKVRFANKYLRVYEPDGRYSYMSYYFLDGTICSFFKERLSEWFGKPEKTTVEFEKKVDNSKYHTVDCLNTFLNELNSIKEYEDKYQWLINNTKKTGSSIDCCGLPIEVSKRSIKVKEGNYWVSFAPNSSKEFDVAYYDFVRKLVA